MLYFTIISITMLLAMSMTIMQALVFKNISLTYAIIAPLFVFFYVLIVLGIFALLLRIALPFKMFSFEHKFFGVSKKEIKYYEKFKIKKWKDKVPELGKSAGFSKKNLQSTEPEYLKKFLDETCFGEVLHAIAGVLGFTCLFFFSAKDYYFVLPILIVNLILNLLPCFIQRYNRYRLEILYNFKMRKREEEPLQTQEDIEDITIAESN